MKRGGSIVEGDGRVVKFFVGDRGTYFLNVSVPIAFFFTFINTRY